MRTRRFEMNSSRWIKTGLAATVVSLCIVSIAFAGDQIRKGDRKRDGSCQSYIVEKSELILAADQTRKRDRKKDGSCLSYIMETGKLNLAADQIRKRDRKKDGSCLS
jgi:hypothetical protein